jgi:Family of unknown function (DUF6483)
MLRKDYLLRQIEMLSAFVARLLKMRSSGDEQGAIDEIEQAYQSLFGLESRLISLMPNEFLLGKLRSGEYLDADQGFTLAVVMREDAANYLAQDDMLEHYQRLTRSLKVFLAIALEHNLAPEQAALYQVDTVLAQMADYALPVDLQNDLFHYFEDEGQFARAEDELHELIDISDSNPQVIEDGISFYEWLLTLSDPELEAGNLPRTEVEESLAELMRLKA